jgi:hypothetical protein
MHKQIPPEQIPPDQIPPDQIPPDQIPPDQISPKQFFPDRTSKVTGNSLKPCWCRTAGSPALNSRTSTTTWNGTGFTRLQQTAHH